MKIRLFIGGMAFLIALCFVSLTTSCRKEQTQKQNTITIGVVLPLTGSLATYGKWSQNGLELAKEELARSGQNVQLVVEDSHSSPKDAVTAFKKLQSVDKVPIIVGFVGSSEALACAPVANETKTVLFSSAAASPDLSSAGDYVFRNRVSGSLEVKDLAR